jgi:transcriptional regulator with XRE-family HTH domain
LVLSHQPPLISYTNTVNDKPTYHRTRRLLKAAKVQGGYTHEDIATKAGLSAKSKSQVSKWLSGDSKATYRQLRYFINKYEHLINRSDIHLFSKLSGDCKTIKYFQIAGEVVLSYTSYEYNPDARTHKKKRSAIRRIRVIKNGERFWTICQDRAAYIDATQSRKYVCGENENSIWWSIATEMTVDELVRWADEKSSEFSDPPGDKNSFASDTVSIPFCIREMLVKQGYSLTDVECMMESPPRG